VFSCADCSPTPEHSAATCAAHQNFRRVENFRINFFEDTGKATPITCTQFPCETRKPLANATGWFDYYTKISDKQQIDGKVKPDFSSIEDEIDRNGSDNEKDEAERMLMFLLYSTDSLTMPLTVVSALEDIKWDKPHLTVHMLGATERELTALANFEELLHLVPGLQSLHITAIGPGIPGPGDGTILAKQHLDCCPPCKADGRQRSISLHKGVYHKFVLDPTYEKPDLVVLFNSGWIDGDDAKSHWEPTIRALIDDNVPALFTTYNLMEAQNEQKKLKELGARFVVGVGENKWRGLVPTPEFIDEENGMWFNNAYRYIIRGKE
jgi:splicing suppressor protein 51